MAERVSAGILLFRRVGGHLELLLAHPGGPRFAARDAGYWSIPKGEVEPAAARISIKAPQVVFIDRLVAALAGEGQEPAPRR
jgi:hypothetical protein